MDLIKRNKMFHRSRKKIRYREEIKVEDTDEDYDNDSDCLERLEFQVNNIVKDILNLNEDLCRKLSEEDKLIMEHTEFKDSHMQKAEEIMKLQDLHHEKLQKLKTDKFAGNKYTRLCKKEQKKTHAKLSKLSEEVDKVRKQNVRLIELYDMKARKYERARKDIESEKNNIKKHIHKMKMIKCLKEQEITNLSKLQYNEYDEVTEAEQLREMKLEILPLKKATIIVHDEQNAENKLQIENMNIVELLVKASTLDEVEYINMEQRKVESDKEQMLNPYYHEANTAEEIVKIYAPMVHKHEGSEIMEYLDKVKEIRNKYVRVCNQMLIFEDELDNIEGELKEINAIIMVHKAKEASYRWEPGLDPGIEEIQKLNEIVKGQSRENFKEVNIQVDNVERNEANKIEEFENIKTENLKLEEIKEIENIITWGNEKNSYGGHTCYQWEPGINNEENTMIDYMEGYKNYRNQKNFLQNEYPPKIDNSTNKCKTNHEIDKSGANMVGCPFHRVKMKNNKRGRTHKNGKMKDETQLLQLLQQLYNKD